MVFIPVPQTLEAKLLQTNGGVQNVNVWNVDVGHTPTPADATALIGVFDAWLSASYKTIVNASVHFDQWVVTDISVANSFQQTAIPTQANGAAAGAPAPANATSVVSLRTARIGRAYRGRTYVTGLSEDFTDSSTTVSAAYATTANVAFTNLINALIIAGYKLVVVSRWLNNAQRVIGVATDVISVITNNKIDSQRRRTAN